VKKIHEVTVEVLNIPELREQMIQRGFEPIGNTPEQFASFISSEISKWAKVIKLAGIESE
jgi:tripartite-type tricarboxylate transporter receptor subunit TctC